jgi:DNA-binding beta-propeller fold protein YncE
MQKMIPSDTMLRPVPSWRQSGSATSVEIRMKFVRCIAGGLLILSAALVNAASNPFAGTPGWGDIGRAWGSTSAVYTTPEGNVWVAERCGENTCVGHEDLDNIFLFDPDGNLIRSFGAGLMTWPHGIHVDAAGNVWVTDAKGDAGRGHQVHKFSPVGELLMSLGKAGIAGEGMDEFRQPSDVLVTPDGSIFVADGHGAKGNNRIMKFDADGVFIKTWGSTGKEDGEFRDPHALAMDSTGRLFVGDRANNRLQIFDQDGNHLETWTQFGRPSGLFIDHNDILYAADSESNTTWGMNRGYARGISIGSAFDGWVTIFIPDPDPDPDNAGSTAAEGVAVDMDGNIYGAEVGPRQVVKYTRRR